MIITVILWITAGLLLIAALLAVLRLTLGPTALDRAVAADLITSVGIGVTALVIVWWSREDLQALMVVFALTGFFSAVAIARFFGRENALERRILTREEAAAQMREEQEREARRQALEVQGLDSDNDDGADDSDMEEDQ